MVDQPQTAPSTAAGSNQMVPEEDYLQIIVKHTSMAQFTLGKDKKITGHTKIRELKKMIADRVGSTP